MTTAMIMMMIIIILFSPRKRGSMFLPACFVTIGRQMWK